ncbi:MAG: MlaD family protein, partial [Gammaproteobacteria bacterium]
MKRDTVNYVMVGAFVVAMGIAFIVFLFAVTGRSGPTDPYYVHYDNVAGLKFGTGVFYEGYRVGQIETITPEPGDSGMRYLLELSVASGWRIPDDSVARVQSSGLISAITIEISEGESQTFHAPGAFITGIEKSDLMSVLNDAAADFRTLSRDGVMPVLKNVNQRVTQLTEEILRFRRDDLS